MATEHLTALGVDDDTIREWLRPGFLADGIED